MNIYKNLHMLLILVIILAIIVSQVISKSKSQTDPDSQNLKEELTICDNLSKSECNNKDQKFMCNYDETRCEECQRNTCPKITSETACVFSNNTATSQQAPTKRTTIPITKGDNSKCSSVGLPDVYCIDCVKGGMVRNTSNPMQCSNNSVVNDDPSTAPTRNYRSDGTYAPDPKYFPSCNIAPEGQIQPYVRKPFIYGATSTRTDSAGNTVSAAVNGYQCVPNPKLTMSQIDYKCPDGYSNIQTIDTAINPHPPIGSCVKNSNYSVITKPTSQTDCGDESKTGLTYNPTTQTCQSKIGAVSSSSTCKIPVTRIKQGGQPFSMNSDGVCGRVAGKYVEYVCPEVGYSLQTTNGEPDGNKPCIPTIAYDSSTSLSSTTLLEQDIPCYYDKDATDTTTGKKGACKDCTIAIQDPNSKNIYCFQDGYGNPICQHPEYVPSELECEAYLSANCKWKNGSCQKK